MDNLSSFTRTQVEGGKWKKHFQGKNEVKGKRDGSSFFGCKSRGFCQCAFVRVEMIKDINKARKAIPPLILATLIHVGVWST